MSWILLAASDGSGESLLREGENTTTLLSIEDVRTATGEGASSDELDRGAWRLRVWNTPAGFEGSIELLPPAATYVISTREALTWAGIEREPWVRATVASALRRLCSIQIGSREHAPEEGLARLAAGAQERLGEEAAELWPELLVPQVEPEVQAPEDYADFVRMLPPRPTQLTVRPREPANAGCEQPPRRRTRTRTSTPRSERLLARARDARRALPKHAKSLLTLVAILVLAAQVGEHFAAGRPRVPAPAQARTRLISVQEWRKFVRPYPGGKWTLVERQLLSSWLAAYHLSAHTQTADRPPTPVAEAVALRSYATRTVAVGVRAASSSTYVQEKRTETSALHSRSSSQGAAGASEPLTSQGGVSGTEASAGSVRDSETAAASGQSSETSAEAQEGASPPTARADSFAGDTGAVSAGG